MDKFLWSLILEFNSKFHAKWKNNENYLRTKEKVISCQSVHDSVAICFGSMQLEGFLRDFPPLKIPSIPLKLNHQK